MIVNKDRSEWFGASDTAYIMGNYQTKTFKNWWLEKLGIHQSTINTKSMKTGTQYEHKILDTIDGIEKDKQILIPKLHLRVNLDGNTKDTIYEVKTHKADKPFKLPKNYREQVLVQMYASDIKKAYIVAYALTDDDYLNYFNEIDKSMISYHEIIYDKQFIELYLEKLKHLCKCLECGVMPRQG